MASTQLSNRRFFLASSLIILSGIGLFVVLAQVLAAAALLPHPLTPRVLWVGFSALLLLGCACLVLRDTSALWQIPLQSLAAAAITLGVGAIVVAAFNNWRLLIGSFGIKALGILAMGIGAGWLMRHLQVRLLPRHDA